MPPHSQLTHQTLSANSDPGGEDSVHVEVRLIFPAMTNCNTINVCLISLKQGLNTLATSSEDELLKSGNVAYMRLLDAYDHAKKQYLYIVRKVMTNR